jgi:Bifunctional DNA primase/polymerase, N-terminal
MSSTVAIGVSIETTERPPVPGVVPVSRTLVDYALHYAQLGFLALPVHGFSKGNCTCGQAPCRSPGKHPVTSNGATGASADPTTFAAWFGAYSVGERNIGIRVCERHFVIVSIRATTKRRARIRFGGAPAWVRSGDCGQPDDPGEAADRRAAGGSG